MHQCFSYLCMKLMCQCAGDLKMTMPTAFTVSMLAWGALAFPSGYQKAHEMPALLNTVRWGADYLMKTWKPDTLSDRSKGYLIIYQARYTPLHCQPKMRLAHHGSFCPLA